MRNIKETLGNTYKVPTPRVLYLVVADFMQIEPEELELTKVMTTTRESNKRVTDYMFFAHLLKDLDGGNKTPLFFCILTIFTDKDAWELSSFAPNDDLSIAHAIQYVELYEEYENAAKTGKESPLLKKLKENLCDDPECDNPLHKLVHLLMKAEEAGKKVKVVDYSTEVSQREAQEQIARILKGEHGNGNSTDKDQGDTKH